MDREDVASPCVVSNQAIALRLQLSLEHEHAMSPVHTKPWAEIVRELEPDASPYLPLVQFIASSDYSSEIFGGVFLSGLLISDAPDFEFCVHMLRVESREDEFVFSYTRGVHGGFQNDTTKTVATADGVQTLDLFVKVKYGVDLGLRKSGI